MSALNKIDLKAKVDANIVTNTQRSITAAKVAEILTDLIDSAQFLKSGNVASQSGNYTLTLADSGKWLEVNSSSAATITIPEDVTVNFDIGTQIEIYQYNTGQVTIAGTGSVVLRSHGNKYKTAGQYAVVKLTKRASNEWVLSGNTST